LPKDVKRIIKGEGESRGRTEGVEEYKEKEFDAVHLPYAKTETSFAG
jgi:hypothetical protein